MEGIRLSFLAVVILMLATRVYTQNLTNVKTLYKDLFSNYTKEIMPMLNYSNPLNIGITFYLLSLNYFKEVEEMASMLGVFALRWTDPSLTWDPASYGNVYSTIIDPKDMWIPELFLLNRVDTMQPIGHDITFRASIYSDGQVSYKPGGILQAKCPTDISKFPFDTQECTLEIIPWGLYTSHLTFKSHHDKAQLNWFNPNSDWKLQEYSTSTGKHTSYSHFYITLKFKRESLYYAVIIILPTILLALLNPCVFVLPVESGERVSLAMTILLSYVIFLTLVTASIPVSSNPMCFLLVIMIVIIIISGIITCGAIISTKYYYEDDISGIFYLVVRFTRWKLRKRHIAHYPVKIDAQKETTVTGKDVSSGIDFLFFYGSYFGLVCSACAYFLSIFT